MIEKVELKKIPVFSNLPDSELSILSRLLKERRVPKGVYVICAEDTGSSMMFIVEGKAKVTLISEDGKEIVLSLLSVGDFFGEISFLTQAQRSANVVSMSDTKIISLEATDFELHIRELPEFCFSIMRELAFRLHRASAKIGDLALYDVYRRVARTLKSLAKKQVENGEDIFVVKEKFTHQELANIVGTSREMVTRALKGLEDDRCIEYQGSDIVIRKIPD